MNANSAHEQIMLEPPWLTNGRVTPVSGRISVLPKMFSQVWKSSIAAAEHAAMEKNVDGALREVRMA